MPLPLVQPELQFIDADGHPIAGGTVATYVPGTTTQKVTWQDMEGTAYNPNPIVLDAAGRAKMYGDGQYRIIVSTASGLLVFDAETSSIASIAMQPVVEAPTIADAKVLLGIEDWSAQIAAETAARIATDGDLHNQIVNETNARIASDGSITANLNAEITNRTNADANLQNQINTLSAEISSATTRAGTLTADGVGNFSVTFTPPFANGIGKVDIGQWNSTMYPIWFLAPTVTTSLSLTTWTGMVQQEDGTPVAGAVANWYAVGW